MLTLLANPDQMARLSSILSFDHSSFILSIFALVTAVMTTYFQFFHHATEVKIIFPDVMGTPSIPGFHFSVADSLWVYQDSLILECTIMNSGSLPVAITASRLFLTALPDLENSHDKQGPAWGQSAKSNGTQERSYIAPQSLTTMTFKMSIDETELARVIKVAADSGYAFNPAIHGSAPTNKWLGLNAGVWLQMHDPNGLRSAQSFQAIELGYRDNGQWAAMSTESELQEMPAFH